METILKIHHLTTEEENNIQQVILSEQARLKNFIRQRVPTEEDAEDVLQDVFYQYINGINIMKY